MLRRSVRHGGEHAGLIGAARVACDHVEPVVRVDHGDQGDHDDLVIHATVDLLGTPPWGPLYRALVGEAQHDPAVAACLNERFIRPQTDKTITRLEAAKKQGQISPDLDLELAMAILSGPLYFRFLINQEPVTHDYVDHMLQALFAGLGARL
ncbi:TetR/AcrR family transcriptional regulator C-terminal ligand-binding domain-containing protein [Micromonospora sp. CPCC 205371]|nr:TetR/AcrR family transcriptional regulator C-terminal ligand-binding domain-containing protein [Micromonospora sp. CPCC 205371]